MAQALPRFCPRCGTPTRANMHICPTCGLPAEAMLGRSGNRPGNSRDAASEDVASEPARVVPTPTHTQQSDQERYRSPLPPTPDFQPSRVSPVQPQQSARFSPPPSQDPWNALQDPTGAPDLEEMPTQVEQKPFASSPGQQPWDIPPGSANYADVEEMPTQVEQKPFSSSPSQQSWDVPRSPANYSSMDERPRGPVSYSGMEEMPTRIEQQPSFSPHPPAMQNQWDMPGGARPMSGAPTPWTAPVEPARPPASVPAPPPPRRRRRGGAIIVVLLLVFLIGGGGYLAYTLTGGHIPGLTPTQSPIKTTKLNFPVNYAGIDITVLSVEQAQNFLDDPQTASNGMLRVNLQEQNKTNAPISWNYNQSARLVPQGGAPIKPVYVKSQNTIDPGATLTSTVDFPIANGGTLSKLLFQLGTTTEAQIQVPLAGGGIDKYKPQTSQQNGALLYLGLNWTLTSATTSLNIPGQQAPSGMEFLTLTLKVDNTLSQEVISGSPFDYLRVKAGGKTASPMETTLPISFPTGQMGKTGTATFLIPQNSGTCTLILLSQDPGTSGQATTDFQVG